MPRVGIRGESVDGSVRWSEQSQHLCMERLEPQNQTGHLLRCGDVQQLDAFKALKDPAHRWAAGWSVELIRDGLLRLGQARAQPILGQPIDRAVRGP